MHIWTKTSPITLDLGTLESIHVEEILTNNYTNNTGFVAWAKQRGISDFGWGVLNNSLGCNCLSDSTVGREMAARCWAGTPTDIPHSPVRDWWHGGW